MRGTYTEKYRGEPDLKYSMNALSRYNQHNK